MFIAQLQMAPWEPQIRRMAPHFSVGSSAALASLPSRPPHFLPLAWWGSRMKYGALGIRQSADGHASVVSISGHPRVYLTPRGGLGQVDTFGIPCIYAGIPQGPARILAGIPQVPARSFRGDPKRPRTKEPRPLGEPAGFLGIRESSGGHHLRQGAHTGFEVGAAGLCVIEISGQSGQTNSPPSGRLVAHLSCPQDMKVAHKLPPSTCTKIYPNPASVWFQDLLSSSVKRHNH